MKVDRTGFADEVRLHPRVRSPPRRQATWLGPKASQLRDSAGFKPDFAGRSRHLPMQASRA